MILIEREDARMDTATWIRYISWVYPLVGEELPTRITQPAFCYLHSFPLREQSPLVFTDRSIPSRARCSYRQSKDLKEANPSITNSR